ncbi:MULTISPECIES: hypothetical protein [unclassified Moritella]|uniref:hypothetical protein n=1 Tax=unclassified Moritella TaxID=2637987 RepID=UPI001BA90C5E|nr:MULTISPECIES: hypothetical protein [unclassified Moritella]QUM84842.1 hypothetical protein HWV02_10200 [Moritella sp. 28]QUM89085.1 hypothetical protein HWV03_09885 [Moritella sp. 36]
MNLFKNTIAVGMLLLTSGVNASSLDSVSAQNNGVFLAMQQLQLEQGKPRSRGVVNADILFIDSNITKADQLTKKMLSAYNAIVIIGDKSNNKTLMIDLFGFGVQRDVIAISNIHDLKTREINTYNVGKDTADMKVATVLSSVISKHIN